VDQSALTGESLPPRTNPASGVLGFDHPHGEIDALVYATGQNTYFAGRRNWCRGADSQPFPARGAENRQLPNHPGSGFGDSDYAVAIFRGDPILTTLQFALVLTVAAIPVAMPTVLSVTMR